MRGMRAVVIVPVGVLSAGCTLLSGFEDLTVSDAEVDTGGPCAQCYTLATVSDAVSMAVDSTHIYWISTGGVVKKLALGGAAPTTLASDQDSGGQIVIDDSQAYWTNPTRGTLMSVPLEGGTPSAVVQDLNLTQTDLAVDATHLYYVSDSTLQRVPLGGGAATDLSAGVEVLHFSIDDQNAYYGVSGSQDVLVKVPLAGETPTALVSSGSPPTDGMAVNGTRVYWAVGDNSLLTVPISGGDPAVVLPGEGPDHITSMTVDDSYVYWTDPAYGEVRRIPVEGEAVTVLADEQDTPRCITLDASQVYWATSAGIVGMPK